MNQYKVIMLSVAVLILITSIWYSVTIFTLTGAVTEQTGDGNVGLCVVQRASVDPIPDQIGYVGTLFTYPINITTNCGEVLSFFGIPVPDLPSFAINNSTGLINFTPQPGEGGVYDINIFVRKKGFSLTSTSFTLTIAGSIKPSNITCDKNETDSSQIVLNWSDVPGADHYTIYYATNISQVANMTSNTSLGNNVTIITPINTSEWIDTDHLGVDRRYYAIAAVVNGTEGYSDEPICGKITYRYTAPVSSVYGTLASNYIVNYFNKTIDAEAWLQDIPAEYNPSLSRLDKSNDAGEYYTSHIRGLDDGNNFVMEPTIGYLLTTDQPYNQTLVGHIFRPPYRLSYDAPVSSIYGTLASNLRGPHDSIKNYTADSFLLEIPAILNPSISRLEKGDTEGEYLISHIRGLDDGNNFNLQPGIGYLITTDDYHNHTTCSMCFQ